MSDQNERDRIREARARKAESSAKARMARFAKSLSGKRVVVAEVDAETAGRAGRDVGRAGFAREIARSNTGGEVTESALRALLERDERGVMPESDADD